jgi:gliding motility-associated-like protein
MKKKILLLLSVFACYYVYGQQVEWVKQLDQIAGTTGLVKVYDIAKDNSGNFYITGTFEGIVDFNPSAVGGELTSYYGSWYSEDPYIAKFDADGNYLWARHIISAQGLGAGNTLVVDASGNVYVSGNQYITGLDSFIARYTAAGTQTYLYYVKGYYNTNGQGEMALDASDNLYYFNRFEGTNTDLDPTSGTALRTSVGGYDAYIAKFTASTGAFLWVKTFGGLNYEETYDIETDGTYLYVTGGFSGTVDFNPDAGVNNLTSVGNNDIYVARYLCSTGAYSYAYSFGSAEYERGYNLEISDNNLFLATQYSGTIDFQPGAGTYNLTSASGGTVSSIALLSYDKNSFAVNWGYNLPFTVQRPSMNIYGTGIIISGTVPNGTFDFDPGAGTHNISSTGTTGAVLCLNADQSFNFAVRTVIPNHNLIAVETDLTNGFFLGAAFGATANIDPDGANIPLTYGSNGYDGFISHWKTCQPVLITTQPTPASATICQGNTQTYSVVATGTTPISYQWYNGGGAISGQTGSSYIASASGSYYCVVTNACGTETSNTVTLTVTPYPSNDDCANAVVVGALPYNSGVMSNNCATNDVPAGSGCISFGANVWFRFTGTGNRVQISTDNAGTNFDTEIHVYTGSCGSLTEVTCDDDSGSGTTSLAYVCTSAATTYYVSVGYYNSSLVYGNYQMTIIDFPIGTPTAVSASPAAICPGASTTLSATPGTNGEQVYWYTGSCGGTYIGTGNSISVSPGANITYYARTYDTDCSQFSTSCGSVSVTVNSNVSITSATAAASPICPASTTQITANGIAGTGATLNWWTGTGGTGTGYGSTNPLTVGPGTYYARVTGTCGTPVEASVTVAAKTVPVAPTSALASPSSVCPGLATNITLTASGGTLGTGGIVQWYTGSCGGTLVGTGSPLVVSQTLASNTTYYARYSGDCGITTCATITVTVNSNVSITSATAAASPICPASTTQITANGIAGTGATLNWWTGTGGTGTGYGSTNPLTVGPGTYYARVTGTCGTPVEASVTITEKTLSVAPTSASVNPGSICQSAATEITLTASGGSLGTGAVVNWYSGSCNGTFVGTGNPLITTVTLTESTNYYASYVGDCNSTSCASDLAKIDNLPIAIAGGSQTICPGEFALINGVTANGGNILWTHTGNGTLTDETSSAPTYNSVASDQSSAIILNLTVTSVNACAPQTATASYTVNVGGLPTAPSFASSDRNNFCTDDAGTINLTAAAGSGSTLRWYDDICGGNEIGTGNPLNIASPTTTTTYFARWENSCGVSSCISTTVTIVDFPVNPISANSNINNFCANDAGNIELNIIGGSGTTAEWFTSSCGGSSAGIGNPLIIPSPEATTTYFVRWTNSCGSSACVSHLVTVNPLPIAPTSAQTDINNFCSDDAGSIELSATGGTGTNLNWYTGSCGGTLVGSGTNLTIDSPETNTIYYARWENGCGNSSCEFVVVNVISSPVAPDFIATTGNNLCTNDLGNISLSAVGGSGTTLRWFTESCNGTEIGTGNPLVIPSPENTTTYFARWENSCGVSTCASITVNIIDAPADPTSATVDISSVCISDAGNIELSLNGGAGPVVEWYSGSCGTFPVGTGNPLVIESPMVTTTYFGRYESSCGNSNCQSVTVTVTDLPQPPASAQSDRDNFCSSDDGDIELSVTGGSGTDVHWFTSSCGDTEIGTGNPLVIESPETTTTYFGRWENSCGVTVCQNVTVTVIQSADATINPAGPLCETGDPIVITAAQIGGTWSGTAIDPATGLFDPEVAGPGDFVIVYTISGTCGDSDDFTISVLELFDATITDVAPMCSNEAAFDLVAASIGGTWSGTGITNSANGTFDPTVAGAGTHIITYENTGLCGDSDQLTITVLQKANATINTAGPYCVTGDPVVITAVQSGGTWSGAAINPTTGLFDPETAGVGDHSITYSIAGDCGDTQNTTITVLPLFDATITEVASMCTGDAAITLTAATAGGTWSGTGITDTEDGIFDPSVAGAGNHVITYTYSGNCGSSDNTTITVAPSADATITHAGPFCIDNDPVVLQAAQIGGTWSGTAVNPANGFFDAEVAGAGEHVITYTITGACGDTDNITIYVLEYFDATITAPETLCFADDTVYLSAANVGGIWTATGVDPMSGALSIDDAGPGILEIIYSYEGLCPDSDTAYISILEFADASFTAPDTLFDNSEIVTLTPTNLGGIWSGNISNTSGLFSPQLSGIGEFEVIYTIEGACGDSDTATIIVIKSPIADLLIPTVITPDGDGFNDRWRIQGIEAYGEVSIKIFTRWGDEVFVFDGTGAQYADPSYQWDGKRNDKELPSGGYVYLLILNGDEVYKGTISLIR